MSETGPRSIGLPIGHASNGTCCEELEETRRLAGALKLWIVFGSVHRLTSPHRPHNSLYVVSDRGVCDALRRAPSLEHENLLHVFTRQNPVTFEIDGVRIGCALGMEVHYPEIFVEYETLGVDCVLFSTAGGTPSGAPAFAAEALGHAASNSYWISFSTLAPQSPGAPSGIASPEGQWVQCPMDVNLPLRSQKSRRTLKVLRGHGGNRFATTFTRRTTSKVI